MRSCGLVGKRGVDTEWDAAQCATSRRVDLFILYLEMYVFCPLVEFFERDADVGRMLGLKI